MNGRPIAPPTSEDHADLQFLDRLLAGRRVVLIGEDWRGASEHQLLKVRLIKLMHEEMGYDVVALHASLYECFMAARNAPDLSAISLLNRCLPGVEGQYGSTEEALALLEYVKNTQGTERPVTLAGFGYGAGSSWEAYPSLFSDIVATIDTSYARVVHERVWQIAGQYRNLRLGKITQAQWTAFLDENSAAFATFFRGLVSFFDAHEAVLRAMYVHDREIPLVARQTAWSTALWMEYDVRKQVPRTVVDFLPDSMWAENIDFLLEKLYPTSKIVVWTQNYYLMLDYARWLGSSSRFRQRLGGFIAQKHRSELYTLALLSYEGQAGFTDSSAVVIQPALRNSLEGLFHAASYPYLFVDMSQQGWSRGGSWMFAVLPSELATPAFFQYDGLLFVDKVTPCHVTRGR